MSGDILAERYERTMTRLEQITRVGGYEVNVQWECEFDDAGIVNQEPELLAHPIVLWSPLRARNALYRDRTEAMCLHYKAKKNETIKYVDVMSLYPYICKYFKFPVGHSVIHVGDVCKVKEACLRMEGLMKCAIVPPERFYHPFLPYRCNNKLMFCLCRTCFLTSLREACGLCEDEERTLAGTWVIDQVRLAVEKC